MPLPVPVAGRTHGAMEHLPVMSQRQPELPARSCPPWPRSGPVPEGAPHVLSSPDYGFDPSPREGAVSPSEPCERSRCNELPIRLEELRKSSLPGSPPCRAL